MKFIPVQKLDEHDAAASLDCDFVTRARESSVPLYVISIYDKGLRRYEKPRVRTRGCLISARASKKKKKNRGNPPCDLHNSLVSSSAAVRSTKSVDYLGSLDIKISRWQ